MKKAKHLAELVRRLPRIRWTTPVNLNIKKGEILGGIGAPTPSFFNKKIKILLVKLVRRLPMFFWELEE
jgi:hypothetical protein